MLFLIALLTTDETRLFPVRLCKIPVKCYKILKKKEGQKKQDCRIGKSEGQDPLFKNRNLFPGNFPKLVGEILHTAISHHIGNFT